MSFGKKLDRIFYSHRDVKKLKTHHFSFQDVHDIKDCLQTTSIMGGSFIDLQTIEAITGKPIFSRPSHRISGYVDKVSPAVVLACAKLAKRLGIQLMIQATELDTYRTPQDQFENLRGVYKFVPLNISQISVSCGTVQSQNFTYYGIRFQGWNDN